MIYFDNGATTVKKPLQTVEMIEKTLGTLGNGGRGGHGMALESSRLTFRLRQALAELISATSPHEIVFTNNGTHSLNLALFGLLSPGDHVITSSWAHNSVLRPLYALEKEGVSLDIVPQSGDIDLKDLEKVLKPKTKALVVTHGSNVTGDCCNLEEVSTFCQEHNLVFLVDCTQTLGFYPIDVEKMGIDLLCFTGHKGLYGPTGTGGIYVSPKINLRPLMFGGTGHDSLAKGQPETMPEKLEAGTLNTLGLAGLLGGLQFLKETGLTEIRQHGLALRGICQEELSKIPQIKIYGAGQNQVATLAFNVGSLDSALVSDYLWEKGEIACRGGLHCAPLCHEFYGTTGQGMVRFSFSYFNEEEEIHQAISVLRDMITQIGFL